DRTALYVRAEIMTTSTGEMVCGLRSVIASRQAPSVSCFCVALNNAEGRFQFRSYGILLGPSRRGAEFADVKNLTQLQLNEVNAYSYSCFVGGPENKYHGLAFHLLRGNVTYMFHGPLWKPLSHSEVFYGNAEHFLGANSPAVWPGVDRMCDGS